jgi:uncharacterized protein
MAKTFPKVILDPVHNLISFDNNPRDRLLLDLINTREFQRLRRIKQLGLCDLVFPGANHSRFAHSIGVMHVARIILQRVQAVLGSQLDPAINMSLAAAALLHDVGHGPFSHAFEKVTKENHEARSLEIITDTSTEVNRVLSSIDAKFPDRVALFIEPVTKEAWNQAGVPLFLKSVVSSQLDADRLDYLLRDSAATGTVYGQFDHRWLLLHLKVDPGGEHIYLGQKARSAVETYVFARHHMYKSVYFHKTTRAAEVMLRLAFQRYRQLLESADSAEAKQAIVPEAPPIILRAFSEKLTLQSYLALDDYVVTEFLKSCEQSSDQLLSALGAGIVHRRLYKAKDVGALGGERLTTFVERAKERARQKGASPEYEIVPDGPADTSYKPYNPAKHKQSEPSQIFIEDDRGQITELSNESEAIHALTKETAWLRYYFPESLREEVDTIYTSVLRGG